MQRNLFSCILIAILIQFSAGHLLAQNENWYLLKSVAVVSDVEAKSLMNELQELQPGISLWYNGSKSLTFGCKSTTEINWSSILPGLISDGYYIADITKGEIHGQGPYAGSSFYYIQARYFVNHPELIPADMVFEFSQAEWNLMPVFIQDFFINESNYVIIPK